MTFPRKEIEKLSDELIAAAQADDFVVEENALWAALAIIEEAWNEMTLENYSCPKVGKCLPCKAEAKIRELAE